MALPFPVRTSIWVLPSNAYAVPAVTRPSNWTLPSTVTRTQALFLCDDDNLNQSMTCSW